MTSAVEHTMKEAISAAVGDSVRAVEVLNAEESLAFIAEAATMIADCFRAGNKVIVAGNGGSLCDAMHFAEEFTGRFRQDRMALPAIALSEPGHITCAGNDFGFDMIFARGVEAYGKPGDLFVGLSTSGNSPNIVKAFEMAQSRNVKTISFLGKDGGSLKGIADVELIIAGFPTSDRIQEAHMAAIHSIIEMVEKQLFDL